jgi:exoribonuclease-2
MIAEKSLVLYKNRAAVVVEKADKITIALSGGETAKVREKDVELLHPGPSAKAEAIENAQPKGDAAGAWELLSGTTVPVSELAELAFGEFTPETAWAAWLLVRDGLLFSGTPDAVLAKGAAEVEAEEAKRNEKKKESAEREAFLARLAKGSVKLPEDARRLQDVEALALGKTDKSKTMKDAGKAETPVEAHKLLLAVGYWPAEFNPHPYRFGKALASAKEPIPPPPQEARLDLRSLRAFAIDNAWSSDPDDAVSLDGDILWVHVADPAASVFADDACDVEARGLGETLYLPEGSFRMLAEGSLPLFALGLTETSPALSFKIALNGDASVKDIEICKTLVRVERLTYGQADALAGDSALAPLFALADKLYARRLQAGAVVIDLPEAHIHAENGEVSVEPIQSYRAADMVREFMLIAGCAAARWAIRNRLPFPFVAQELGDLPADPLPGLAGSYQLRRCMRPRRLSAVPGEHAGLGLSEYTQVTSPLRRYTDLVAHQQIRAFLDGKTPQTADEVLARIAAGEAAAQAAVQAERASRQHWTMVLLSRMKNAQWDAVVVERKGGRATVLIPALAMEASVAVKGEAALNDTVRVAVSNVKIPELEASFVLV